MTPNRRRLARRRASAGRRRRVLSVVLLGSLSVGLLVGALFEVGPTSRTYDRNADRSFAALAAPLAAQTQQSAASLARIVDGGATQERPAFFSALDALAASSAATSRAASALSAPGTAARPASSCREALADRAAATAVLRSGLEQLLGGPGGGQPGSEAVAATDLGTVGADLGAGDTAWQQCRAELAALPGRARLAPSVWVADASSWSPSVVGAFTGAVAGSPSLAAAPGLAVTVLETDPRPVSVSSGAQVLPPAGTFTVHTVVGDTGNVEEHGVVVRVSLEGPGAPGAAVPPKTVELAAGSSVAVDFPGIALTPSTFATVVVDANGPGASTTASLAIAVAPGATTTTVAPAPAAGSSHGR